jgi:hypothetical protein
MKKQILSLLASAFIATNPVKAANLTERVFVEELGVNSQTTISHTSEDKTKVKALAETLPNNYEDYGLDVRNSIYRANFSLDDGVNRESRTSLTLYGDNGLFAGASFQDITGPNRTAGYLGSDISRLHLEATADTEKGLKGAIQANITESGSSQIGIGGGENQDGSSEWNASYNNSKAWAAVRWGNRPLDARMALGKVGAKQSQYFQSVTESGINELDKIADETLQFDIGQDSDLFLDYFGARKFLDKTPGSKSLYARFKEDNRAWADVAVRTGDLGSLKQTSVTLGAFRDIKNDYVGAKAQFGFNIGQLEFELITAYSDNHELKGGLYGKVEL